MGCNMNITIGLVVLILVASVVLTLLVTGKNDENYRKSTKQNTANLSLMYGVIILAAFISLGVYIWLT